VALMMATLEAWGRLLRAGSPRRLLTRYGHAGAGCVCVVGFFRFFAGSPRRASPGRPRRHRRAGSRGRGRISAAGGAGRRCALHARIAFWDALAGGPGLIRGEQGGRCRCTGGGGPAAEGCWGAALVIHIP